MFFFDINYIVIVGPFLLLAMLAAGLVRMTFAKYSRVGTSGGWTGGRFARQLLDQSGLHDVPIEVVPGELSDHYDPRSRVLRLSAAVYNGQSAAAIGVAAHEVGHAIQHQRAYLPLMFRNQFYPIAAIGSQAWVWLFLLGLFIPALSQPLLMGAVLCFAVYVVFALVTLPVEFNASARAMAAIRGAGIMTVQEANGAQKVLTAAALTYVASALQAIATLVYIFLRSRD